VLKKIIASAVVGAALLVGIASTGAASAASPTATASATAPTGSHPHAGWLRAHRREIRRAGIALSAKTIGVTPKDLVTELRSGKSIAGVAGEHNVSAQTVVNALVSAADADVNKAVASHQLTSAQGAKIEGKLPGYVTKVVNHTF